MGVDKDKDKEEDGWDNWFPDQQI